MISRRRILTQGGAALLGLNAIPRLARGADPIPLKTDVPLEKLTAELKELIPRVMEREKVPGLSIAIIRDARVVWTEGFGVKSTAHPKPVDADTIFEVASLTKPTFAYAMMKLKEEGKIDLDKPCVEYVPSFIPKFDTKPEQQERLRTITSRHLLSHTSGIIRYEKDGRLLTVFVPGRRFNYFGDNYGFLQTVFEKVTGAPLADYMQTNLLDPFGLKESCYIWRPEYETQAAGGHIAAQNIQGRHRRPVKAHAAASLHSTAAEYAQFMINIMRPPPPDTFHLRNETLDEMLTPQIKAKEGIQWALGWGLQETASGNSFWHYGNWGDFQAFAVGYRSLGLGTVVLANSSTGLRACKEIVPAAVGGEHPALSWPVVVA